MRSRHNQKRGSETVAANRVQCKYPAAFSLLIFVNGTFCSEASVTVCLPVADNKFPAPVKQQKLS